MESTRIRQESYVVYFFEGFKEGLMDRDFITFYDDLEAFVGHIDYASFHFSNLPKGMILRLYLAGEALDPASTIGREAEYGIEENFRRHGFRYVKQHEPIDPDNELSVEERRLKLANVHFFGGPRPKK